MKFGVVNTYDLGECTGPFKCQNLKHYGPTVGIPGSFLSTLGLARTQVHDPIATCRLAARLGISARIITTHMRSGALPQMGRVKIC